MTHIPEVLEVMESGDNSTSKKAKKALRVPYVLAFPISVVLLLSILASSILIYKYFSCQHFASQSTSLDRSHIDLETYDEIFSAKPKKNLRLPRSVVPSTYKLKIVPFIWEGNIV